MSTSSVKALSIIAGRGAYPRNLAESARQQGVERIVAVAFKKETDPALAKLVDEIRWVHLGQLGALLDALSELAIPHVVMAGQIKPTHLFHLRMDKAMLQLLAGLKTRNAHTIFGAVGEALAQRQLTLMPASLFMEKAMPEAGVLAGHAPTEEQQADIQLGLRVAKETSGLEIGQTVMLKQGTILAVEAFEGTDETIERGGRLGGEGGVVVKVAKRGHDMRFDIPVIGERTLRKLKGAKAAVLAVEAGRTILLDREELQRQAERQGLTMIAVEVDADERSRKDMA